MTLHAAGSKVFQFTRSLLLLAVLVVGVPLSLVWAARQRFGGPSPMHGVPSPAAWEWARIQASLTDRLSEETIADIVIRSALVIAWVALVVFVLTVIAEAVHMVRHHGLHLPDVRGLGLTQHAARMVAAGLLIVLPMFSSPGRAVAHGDATLTPLARAAATAPAAASFDARGTTTPGTEAMPTVAEMVARISTAPDVEPTVDLVAPAHTATSTTAPRAGEMYLVRAGDSIYGIADHVAGPDAGAIADYAERLIDANLGHDMGDGRRFVNAAFIDVGWVLQLPPIDGTAPVAPPRATHEAVAHVVEPGDSLWSIAEVELGDPTRWPEIYEANEGRTFDDGGTLDEPDLIQPGWSLLVPGDADEPVEQPEQVVQVDDVAVPGDADELGPDRPSWDAPIAVERRDGPATDAPHADETQSDTVWVDMGGADASPTAAAPPAVAASAASDEVGAASGFGLVSLRTAAMLSGGVLALLAVRRRRQLRQAPPRARLPEPTADDATIERILRASDAGERLARVDIAIRSVALTLVEQGRRVQIVLCAADGEVELMADGPIALTTPWQGQHERWVLAATTPIELLAPDARRVGAPCPTLIQLGIDEIGRDVYVDLEALEAIEIAGAAADADAIIAAVAMMLAGSALAEVTTMVSVAVADDAFLGHRLHRTAPEPRAAFDLARREIGATATVATSTFELRSRATGGETWEPAVVLIGSGVEVVRPPRDRTGLAVVSAAPIEGPSSRLAPEDGMWMLRPAGIRLRPVGIGAAEVGAIAGLVRRSAAIPTIPHEDDMQLDDDFDRAGDQTIYEPDDLPTDSPPSDGESDSSVDTPVSGSTGGRRPKVARAPMLPVDDWQLLVRVLGPVDVVDAEGCPVDFERSKTKELVTWLAMHRDRATRNAARTALWEHDVRDATFANVVSEARRALARLVDPPAGDEWVGRTMTEALPLHPNVRSDVELLESALAAARVQPPDQAIVTLTPAVERISGVPFQGTTYLWPDAEGITSNLILLATSAAAELAAHCLSVGDVEGVFRATGRGLQVLAGHEELIGLRMRAHARVGDLAGVRSEWETYERMIDADPWSDGEPSPKLVDLRTRLMNPSR